MMRRRANSCPIIAVHFLTGLRGRAQDLSRVIAVSDCHSVGRYTYSQFPYYILYLGNHSI
jgi:hypothetical protein